MIAIPMALAMMALVIVTVRGIQNRIVQVINSIMIECTRSYLDTTFGTGKKSHYPSLCLQNYLVSIWVAQILPTMICCLMPHVIRISVMQGLGVMGFYILNSLKRCIFF